jgi:hypothetical protein
VKWFVKLELWDQLNRLRLRKKTEPRCAACEAEIPSPAGTCYWYFPYDATPMLFCSEACMQSVWGKP